MTPKVFTGAAGYWGGRPLHRREASGRSGSVSDSAAGGLTRIASRTEVAAGDVLDAASLRQVFDPPPAPDSDRGRGGGAGSAT